MHVILLPPEETKRRRDRNEETLILHINSDGFRLAPWTFSRNRGKMAITSPLS